MVHQRDILDSHSYADDVIISCRGRAGVHDDKMSLLNIWWLYTM